MSDDLHWLGIADIGAGYRDGSLTPDLLVVALLARIAALDGRLNAFVHVDRDGAVAAAAAATAELRNSDDRGALHGIPIGIKDIIDVAGLPTTCHSRTRLGMVADTDADVVATLRNAGAIIIGKLATHEFAIGGPSFDLPLPPARNPWNREHHPGGSSSGAGAAVAAGFIPAAIGTDTAGSVRNPASCCGIAGLKPTYGSVSRTGVFPLAWSLDHVGPLARSIADVAILHGVMTGTDTAPAAAAAGLRIGYVRHFHTLDMVADAEVTGALDSVAATLAAAGASVSDAVLPPLGEFALVNRFILQAEGFAIHGRPLRERPQDYAERTRRALLPGAFLSAEDYLTARRRQALLTAAVDRVFADFDVLLTASSMTPVCRIDDAVQIDRTYLLQARGPFNVTGHPALAMMAGLSAGGLPLSVQFVARRGEEATLFSAASAWERAMGGPMRPAL